MRDFIHRHVASQLSYYWLTEEFLYFLAVAWEKFSSFLFSKKQQLLDEKNSDITEFWVSIKVSDKNFFRKLITQKFSFDNVTS